MGLDTVELVLAVEKVFNIELPDNVASELDTVGKLHEHVVAEHVRLNRDNVNADIIFDQLRTIICYQLGVDPAAVLPEARFVQDLGAD